MESSFIQVTYSFFLDSAEHQLQIMIMIRQIVLSIGSVFKKVLPPPQALIDQNQTPTAPCSELQKT